MLTSVRFQNRFALADVTIPFEPFTVLVGPNGSGKTTVLESLDAVARAISTGPVDDWTKLLPFRSDVTVGSCTAVVRGESVTYRSVHGAEHRQAAPAEFSAIGPVRMFALSADAIRSILCALGKDPDERPVLPATWVARPTAHRIGVDAIEDEHHLHV